MSLDTETLFIAAIGFVALQAAGLATERDAGLTPATARLVVGLSRNPESILRAAPSGARGARTCRALPTPPS